MSYVNRSFAAFWGGLVLWFWLQANAQESTANAPAEPVQAIWKPQQVDFTFESFTTFYSCSSLETKVKRVLTAVGVNPMMKVRTRGCFDRNRFSRMSVVEIELITPVEATPEALAELDKTRSVRELTARVRGDSKLAKQAEQPFPAQWQRVSLSRGALRLESGDCELIEQLKRKIFPKLGVRLIEDRVRCIPNMLAPNQPRLIVEVLTPLPEPDSATPTTKD